jgi:ribosomal protein S27E
MGKNMTITVITTPTLMPPKSVDEETVVSFSDALVFTCPICGELLKIPQNLLWLLEDDDSGRWIGNCPKCTHLITVYAPD